MIDEEMASISAQKGSTLGYASSGTYAGSSEGRTEAGSPR
jgi:hypothetical protein